MKKIIPLLIVPIVVLSIVSGLLFNQLLVVQTENSELRTEVSDVNARLEGKQTVGLQLESQLNELENQLRNVTNLVRITDFRFEGFAFPPVTATTYCSDYIVTVENFGINDVENLTVVFDGDYFDGYQYHAKYGFNPDGPYKWSLDVGTVKVRESKTVHEVHVIPEDSTFVIQLMLNDTVLDER